MNFLLFFLLALNQPTQMEWFKSGAAQELLDETVERVQDQSFNDWLFKILILGEGVVIYWLYNLLKDQKQQTQFLEGIRNIFQSENQIEITHRRFSKLLYAIGWDVLYIAQGNFNSVRKLIKNGRVLLFFKSDKRQETIYFLKEIKEGKVFCHILDNLDEEQESEVSFDFDDFFREKTFSFIVFLGTRCESCFNLKSTILGEVEDKNFD